MGLNLKKFKTEREIYEIILCKPNREQIAVLNDIIVDEVKMSKTTISSIKFKLPKFTVHNHSNILTPYWKSVVGDYQLFVNGDMYFMIVEPELVTDASGKEYKSFIAYSAEHEFNKKIVRNYDSNRTYEDGVDYSNELYREVLDPSITVERMPIMNYISSRTTWSIGYVNPKFLSMRRTFQFSESTLYAMMKEIQLSYQCLFDFDTVNKVINIIDIDEGAVDSGILISDSNYIKSFKEKFNHENIVTRLRIYGKDDITVRDYNPLGVYLEDFSFFKNTEYMTQGLIDALDQYNLLLEQSQPTINAKNVSIEALYDHRTADESEIHTVNQTLARIAELERKIFNWERDRKFYGDIAISAPVTGNDIAFGPYSGNWGNQSIYDKGVFKQEFNYTEDGGVSYSSIFLNPNLAFERWTYSETFKSDVDYIQANGLPEPGAYYSHFNSSIYTAIYSLSALADVIEYLNSNPQYIQKRVPSIGASSSPTTYYNDLITDAQAELGMLQTVVQDGSEYGLVGIYNKIKNDLDKKIYERDTLLTYETKTSSIESRITTLNSEIRALESSLASAENDLLTNANQIATLESERAALIDSLSKENNFTENQMIELDYFVREGVWSDANFFSAKELFEEGKIKLKYLSQPGITFDIDAVALTEMMGNGYNTGYLELGDYVYVRHNTTKRDYKVRLIGYAHKPTKNTYTLTFTNKDSLSDSAQYLQELFKNAKAASSSVNMNKYKWDKAEGNATEINTILNNAWDAAKNAVLTSNGQIVTVDQRGIGIKDGSDANQNEQLRMINNVIAMTTNNWATADLAITPKGIYAKKLIGEILAGNNLTITGVKENDLGEVISNTVVIDGDGFSLEGTHHNGVTINSEVGFEARADNVTTTMNASRGIYINNGVKDVFYADELGNLNLEGNIVMNNGTISWDSVPVPTKEELSSSLVDYAIKTEVTAEIASALTEELAEYLATGDLNSELSSLLAQDTNSLKTWIGGDYVVTGALAANQIVAGKIQADQMALEQLEVGTNIAMGPNAVISWDNLDATAKTKLNPDYSKHVYKRSSSHPATPTGSDPSSQGWSENIPTGTDRLYTSIGRFSGETNTLIGSWSTPYVVEGKDGTNGVDGVDGTDGSDANVNFNNILNALQAADGIENTFITADTGGFPRIYGGKIYGAEIHSGTGTAGTSVISLTEDGFNLFHGTPDTVVKIGAESGDSDWSYPYMLLGRGVDSFGTDRGMIKKFSNGLWFGDSDSVSQNSTAPSSGTGIFVDFNSNTIRKYENGTVSDIGSGDSSSAGGSSTFAGNGSPRTVNHGLGSIPTSVTVTPATNPGGWLGEIWIANINSTSFTVYNSGSFTGAFNWIAV